MNKFLKIISWCFSIGFGVAGLALIAKSPLAGLFSIALGVLLFPKTKEFVQKKFGYTLSGKVKTGLVIVLLIAVGITSPKSDAPAVQTTQEVKNDAAPIAVKTDQEKLEDSLKQASTKPSITYRKVEIEKADSDRPQDSKMITASYSVSEIYNKSSFLKDSGKIAAEAFKSIFGSNLNAYDAVVWYYGETTDKYGNKKDDVILSYAMDKTTFAKINWQNFNASKLCEFLKEEGSGDASFSNACNVLVNIQ
jgi:hypothetical protein